MGQNTIFIYIILFYFKIIYINYHKTSKLFSLQSNENRNIHVFKSVLEILLWKIGRGINLSIEHRLPAWYSKSFIMWPPNSSPLPSISNLNTCWQIHSLTIPQTHQVLQCLNQLPFQHVPLPLLLPHSWSLKFSS